MKLLKKFFKVTQIITLISILIGLIFTKQVSLQTLQPLADEYRTAWDFELLDLDDKKFQLSKYRGNIIVLNFWETWCPDCIKEMPSLNRLVGNFKKEKKVLFWAISHEDKLTLQEYLSKNKFNYHHFYNGQKVRRDYNVQFVPIHIIIDQKGKIRYSFPADDQVYAKLSQGIKKILKELKEN